MLSSANRILRQIEYLFLTFKVSNYTELTVQILMKEMWYFSHSFVWLLYIHARSKINWKECRNIIHDSLKTYCKNWIKCEHFDTSFFNAVMKIVNMRIKHFDQHFRNGNTSSHSFPYSKEILKIWQGVVCVCSSIRGW